jgi:hypothetical protein
MFDLGKQYIYGYVPIVVTKIGVFLKEKGKILDNNVHLNGFFLLNGKTGDTSLTLCSNGY